MPATAPAAAKLTGSDRKVLAVLAEYTGEVSNPDLKAAHGFTLVGAQRRKLDAKGYVTSRKQGRYFVHTLTGLGRSMGDSVASERIHEEFDAKFARLTLDAARAARATAETEAYEPKPYFPLAEATVPGLAGQPTVEDRVRAAYLDGVAEPGGWMSLTRLRSTLPTVDRAELDAELRRMEQLSDVFITPEANQKALRPEDRAAAVRIGGKDKHLIAIQGAS